MDVLTMEFFIHKTEAGFTNTGKWKKYLNDLPVGTYRIEVAPYSKRTLKQSAWFHAVLPDILKGLRDIGYNEVRNEDDAKDFIKSIFFKKTVSNGVDSVTVIEGTSKQSKLNFAEKAEDIIIWAQQYLGIDIAPPAKQFEIYQD